MSENFINLDVKWINVFQNGDVYTPPIKFVVYRKHLRNFDVFLNSLTQRLKPRFGAIRNLYTPVHGQKITSLDDLEPNQTYVAAGTEKFRKVRYGTVRFLTQHSRSNHIRPYSLVEIQPVVHSAIKVASRYKTAIKNSAALTIFVYRNGDDIAPPKVVPLVKKDLRNWDIVLKRVGEKVIPYSSCHLRRLCCLNGTVVNRMTDLLNGEFYVAVVGREHFKCVSYGMLNPPVSRKFTNWSLADFASPHRRLKSSANNGKFSEKKYKQLEYKRLYAGTKRDENNASAPVMNSLFEEETKSVPQTVFDRLYKPPPVVKFPVSISYPNLKHENALRRPLTRTISSQSAKRDKYPRSEWKREENKLFKKAKDQGVSNHKISLVAEAEQEEKLVKEAKPKGQGILSNIKAVLTSKENSEDKKKLINLKGVEKNEKNPTKNEDTKKLIDSKGVEKNVEKSEKDTTVKVEKGQGASKDQKTTMTAEEEAALGDKPFIVLSLIERLNPFKGARGKTQDTQKVKKINDTTEKKKSGKGKAEGNNTKSQQKREKNTKGKADEEIKKKSLTNSEEDDLQLFGGYHPHKILENRKLRDEIMGQDRKSSIISHVSVAHNSLGNSQNEPVWVDNYYINNAEEKKQRATQAAWQKPTKIERHRAGYDSGRTQSSMLPDREKQRKHLTAQSTSTSIAKIKEVDYDEDNSGVYRAKLRKDSSVKEVKDSETTAVELPIDSQVAEEINDEEIIPLTRKPARELNSNNIDENCAVNCSYPSVEVYVDEKSVPQDLSTDGGSKNKFPSCHSPQEQRDSWCNEMRKLKDRLLSKIHHSEEASNKYEFDTDMDSNRTSSNENSARRPLVSETRRLLKTHEKWSESVKKSKSKLRKPRIFTNKSTSSCASDATTYTVESSSSSNIARNKSSTEESTDSSKSPIIRKGPYTVYSQSSFNQLSPQTTRTSPLTTEISPQSSTQSNGPCFGESATTNVSSGVNESSLSDVNTSRELSTKTYVILEKDSLEDVLWPQFPSSDPSSRGNHFELPSGKRDFSNPNSFKTSVPFVRRDDVQVEPTLKSSIPGNFEMKLDLQAESRVINSEDGRQINYFQEEIGFDSLSS